MKLLPTVVLVLTGLLAGTGCQQIPPKPENASVEPGSKAAATAPQLNPEVRRLKEQFSLTEEQTNKLNKIFQDNNAQREPINVQRKALAEQLSALQKKKVEQINAVLTSKQAQKYKKLLSEPPPEVMGAQPSTKTPELDRAVELKKQLRLSKQQTNKINDIFQDTNTQREAINTQRADLRKQASELQKKKWRDINAVLTADQAKKYEKIRNEPPAEIKKTNPFLSNPSE